MEESIKQDNNAINNKSENQTQSTTQSVNSELEKINNELEKVKKERDEYLAGWQRAKADFINYKKEDALRFEEVIKFSNKSLMQDLIGVLDSFSLGLDVLEKNNKEVDKGIYMIKSQLEDVLKKYGLNKINIKVGDDFNPNTCESIGEIDSQEKSGKVAQIIEDGYMLNGKVIRPVRVKLSKGQTKNNQK